MTHGGGIVASAGRRCRAPLVRALYSTRKLQHTPVSPLLRPPSARVPGQPGDGSLFERSVARKYSKDKRPRTQPTVAAATTCLRLVRPHHEVRALVIYDRRCSGKRPAHVSPFARRFFAALYRASITLPITLLLSTSSCARAISARGRMVGLGWRKRPSADQRLRSRLPAALSSPRISEH